MDNETFEIAKTLMDVYWAYDGLKWYLTELDNPNPKAQEVSLKSLDTIGKNKEFAKDFVDFLEAKKEQLMNEFKAL